VYENFVRLFYVKQKRKRVTKLTCVRFRVYVRVCLDNLQVNAWTGNLARNNIGWLSRFVLNTHTYS